MDSGTTHSFVIKSVLDDSNTEVAAPLTVTLANGDNVCSDWLLPLKLNLHLPHMKSVSL